MAVPSWAGPGIGTVTDTKGTACEIERNKAKMSGVKGAGVESMDTYVTAGCAANITFKDDTKVKVTENSRLLIDDFVFDPKHSDAGKLAIKVGMGTVRYASGQIAKNNPQQVNIKTPSATVAVRGTDFAMTVDESGQSLIVLLPSCKDDKDIKQFEMDEQKCKVGKIEVETLAGKVVIDEAFHATFVSSVSQPPTAPTSTNLLESKINNNLIIVKPMEVQRAIAAATGKTQREKEMEDAEQDQVRRMNEKIAKERDDLEQARVLELEKYLGKTNCNPSSNICVAWDKSEAETIQQRGKGIAFRYQENEHYAEIKTQGYSSNTTITITQNDSPASEIIGDGSPGGNVVNIKQNTGWIKRR